MRKKRILSLLLVFCLVIAIMPTVNADNTYRINGVNVHNNDYSSAPDDCWTYANNFYCKIWGYWFSNSFDDGDNSLRNLNDEELTLNPEHLKIYVSNAAVGSVLRICNSDYLHSYDGWGHSQLIVQKDDNGFTVFEGGLTAYPYHREKYFTWNEYCSTGYLGQYSYIKYIKWPGAPAFSSAPVYLSKCTILPYSAKVEAPNSAGFLKSLPCSDKTDASSEILEGLKKGDSFTVDAKVINSAGNLWYRTTYDGKTGYLYSGDVNVVEEYPDTLALSGANYPTTLTPGAVYSIYGTVTSAVSNIKDVTVAVYDADKNVMTGTTVYPNTKRFDIHALDNDLRFDWLAPGRYYYNIGATNGSGFELLLHEWFTVGSVSAEQAMPEKATVKVSVKDGKAVFTWGSTANTTHYNFWMYKKDANGNWKEADHSYYVSSGMTRSVSDGEYRALVQSYDSEHWFADHSDWLYTESDYVYFTVNSNAGIDSTLLPAFHDKENYVYSQGQFSDVAAGQWYSDAIAKTYALGLFKGVSATRFEPNGEVTLAQIITLGARLHSVYHGGSGEFQSTGGAWYQSALDYMLAKNVPMPFKDMNMERIATRAEVAGMFYWIFYNDLPEINNVPYGSIPDLAMAGAFNYNEIYELYRAGIVCGSDVQRNFRADTSITRAETATIILRLLRPASRVAFSI